MANTKLSFKELLEQTKSRSLDEKKDKDTKSTPKDKKSTDQMLTKNGYDVFEVMSALQKMVRRGKEAEAMYWAFELESFNSVWLWKRLTIISTEDIGIADPSVQILINSLWVTYDRMKNMANGKTPESHILGMAILSLCRAKKNHEAMYLPMTVNWWRKYLGWKIDIPDVALDIHTRRGKKMGRGRNHWYSEGFRVNNKETIEFNRWENAFRIGDEIKYDLLNAEDYYYHKHKGEYVLTEEDDIIGEDGLPTYGLPERKGS
jgi:replication-associated recombination protein RarA